MAMFAVKRIFGFGGSQIGRGPLKMWFPIAESQTALPGDPAVMSSGLVSATKGGTELTTYAGIIEERIATARSSGELVLLSMATPQALFEATVVGVLGRFAGTVHPLIRNTSGATTAVLRNTAANTTSPLVIVAGIGDQMGVFSTGGFIGKNATSVTAGTTNRPYASVKGKAGDTNARVIFYFPPAASVWD